LLKIFTLDKLIRIIISGSIISIYLFIVHLKEVNLELNKEYSCLLLVGPRQVGKSTMLEHLMKETNRRTVTLDDLEERRLAKNDPKLFLELHPAPVLIDEIQYAPELFSYIKIHLVQM
jgi:predicted AAA+ superfamily ATPase